MVTNGNSDARLGDRAKSRGAYGKRIGFAITQESNHYLDDRISSSVAASFDRMRVINAVEALLLAIGENPRREGLIATPRRVADSYSELLQGYSMNPSTILGVKFAEATDMVSAIGVRFYSLCEHHLLPFFGRVDIGYVPNEVVVGISKLDRLVLCYSRRLQLQERMTRQIADSLDTNLHPRGVIVVVRAKHLCKEMRGVRSQGLVETRSVRGAFEDDALRHEFLRLTEGRI